MDIFISGRGYFLINYDEYVKAFDELVQPDSDMNAFDFLFKELENEDINTDAYIYLKFATEPYPVCFNFSVMEQDESYGIAFIGVETFD